MIWEKLQNGRINGWLHLTQLKPKYCILETKHHLCLNSIMEYFIANIKKHSVLWCFQTWTAEKYVPNKDCPLILCMEIGYYLLFMLDYAMIVAI